MIQLSKKEDCCGCSACAQRCPVQCIAMKPDNEGFLYPQVDETKCIGCGLCDKVCHELHPFEGCLPQDVYAAINKNDEIRMESSSGGIFSLLAEKTIGEGGVVFGARFDEKWQVVIGFAETMDDVRPFYGSKYVQARIDTAYRDAEDFLKAGRKVLFSGCPCQVAGLHHYLRKPYDNLVTVDFVCHGVPSPKVWSMYLDEVVNATRRIDGIKFRDKRNGWKRFNFVLTASKGEATSSMYSFHGENHYMRAFLSDLILRPSCYDCKAKEGRSHSDITIADYWGIEYEHPEMDDDKGTGLVLVNTEKGSAILDWSKVLCVKSTIMQASKYNGGLSSHTRPHPKREAFFSNLDKNDSVIALINSTLRPHLLVRAKQLAKKCILLIYSGVKVNQGGKW